jgi:competence protein ComEA
MFKKSIFHAFSSFIAAIFILSSVALFAYAEPDVGEVNENGLSHLQHDLININQVDAQQLSRALKGVGIKKAEAIIAWRAEHGDFTHKEQLLEVNGIGASILAKIESQITL